MSSVLVHYASGVVIRSTSPIHTHPQEQPALASYVVCQFEQPYFLAPTTLFSDQDRGSIAYKCTRYVLVAGLNCSGVPTEVERNYQASFFPFFLVCSPWQITDRLIMSAMMRSVLMFNGNLGNSLWLMALGGPVGRCVSVMLNKNIYTEVG